MPAHIDKRLLSRLISDPPRLVDWTFFSQADWTLLLREADREGVGPLLYWRFSKSGKLASLPGNVQESLRVMYARTWSQNQLLFKELEVLAQLFHERGIPVVVLKGACFALTIYLDIGLRPMGDLDLLVPASRWTEAVACAESLGYADAVPEASPGLDELLSHHAHLRKSGAGSIILEIHNSLVADKSFVYAVPVDWFWTQTESLDSSSNNRFEHLLTLTPTAQLLYAASHAMLQHGGFKTPLRWYYDLDQLIRSSNERLDWELLLSQARNFAWGSALQAALSQTQDLFDTPVPEDVRFSLSLQTDRLGSLVRRKQARPATRILEEHQKLLSLSRYGRIRLVWALLFPSLIYMRWRYGLKNSWTLPVWYLIRWAGILRDGMNTVISLVRGKALVS